MTVKSFYFFLLIIYFLFYSLHTAMCQMAPLQALQWAPSSVWLFINKNKQDGGVGQ